MICQLGGVKLRKGKSYEFSCRGRVEGLRSGNVSVTIQDMAGWHACGLRTTLPLSSSWKTFRRVFKARRTAHKSTRLQFWFNEPGTFYLDKVGIVELPEKRVEFTHVVSDANSKNLVPNGSFEAGSCGWSSLGKGVGWGNLARLHGQIETTGGAHGQSFLRIPVGGDNSPVLHFDYFEPTVKREIQLLAANIGWIRVEQGKKYTISCFIRSSAGGINAVLGVRTRDPERKPLGQTRSQAKSEAYDIMEALFIHFQAQAPLRIRDYRARSGKK